MTVTAVELAARLHMDPKRLRGFLRRWAAQGHPLLRSHAHQSSWVFSAEEAEVLAREITSGGWAAPRDGAPAVTQRASPDQPIDVLLAQLTSVPQPASRVLPPGVLPSGPGLYAWWAHRGVVPGLVHIAGAGQHPSAPDLELLYVGLASDLSRRIRQHLRGNASASTLRRVLGAWLRTSKGWVVVSRGGRVVHDAASEQALTRWMAEHLLVTWAEHGDPQQVEPALIARLAPPLNSDHNQAHPNWPTVRAARAAWRDAALPAPPDRPV